MKALEWVAENLSWLQGVCLRAAGKRQWLAEDLYGECIDISPRLDQSYDPAKGPLENYLRRSYRLHCLKKSVTLRRRSSSEAAEFNEGAPVEFVYAFACAAENTVHATLDDSNEVSPKARREVFVSRRTVPYHECKQVEFDTFDEATQIMQRLELAERLLIVEYFWQGKSMATLADETGVTKKTIHDRLHAIIQKIRSEVNGR